MWFCQRAHAEKPPAESWTLTFHFENDLFAETDRFYTNGIKASFVSPDLDWFEDLAWMQKNAPLQLWTKTLINVLPFNQDSERQRKIAFTVGQKIYTPEDISQSQLILDDRPYAGWLYGSTALHSKSYRKLDTFELQLGFTGDLSLAEEAQNFVHEIRGIDKAKGWDNQIDTELGVVAIYDRKYRLIPRNDIYQRWGYDVIIHGGAAAGTVFSHVSAGAEFRFGWNIPTDFGTALIRPAGDVNAPADTNDPRYAMSSDSLSVHVFVGTSARVIWRDIFLDGNTFSTSHGRGKKPLVADFAAGVSVIYRGFKLSYAQVLRSKEFAGQGSEQNFGSISLSYTY